MPNRWDIRIVEFRKECPASEFQDHGKNWRIHPEAQKRGVVKILDLVGKVAPLLAYHSEQYGGLTLYNGHLRKNLDPDETWPVAIADLTDDEAKFVIATLDPVTGMADIDYDILEELVEDIGPQEEEIAAILATLDVELPEEKPPLPDQGPQIDRAEELQKVWKVETGQVWRCGEHYVICGDCREPETWKKLLSAAGVEKVNGVFTSPPYAEQRKKQYGGVPVDQYVEWWDAVQQNVRDNLAEDGSFFVNIKPHCEKGQRVLYVFDLVLAMVRRWEWRFVDELCWKRQGIPGEMKGRFKNVWEPVYHFVIQVGHCHRPHNVLKAFERDYAMMDYSEHPHRKSTTRSGFETGYGNQGFVKYGKDGALPGNLIIANQGATLASSGIGAQAATFPVALPDFFVKAYSDEGDVWLDPFLGSGTTIVAAYNNGRRGIGIERLEKYVAVCLQRFQDAFGVEPVLVE